MGSSAEINSGFGQALGPGRLAEETAGAFAEDSAVSALEEETAQAPTAQDLRLQSVSTLHRCSLPLQPYPSEPPPAPLRSSSNTGAGAAELLFMASASP